MLRHPSASCHQPGVSLYLLPPPLTPPPPGRYLHLVAMNALNNGSEGMPDLVRRLVRREGLYSDGATYWTGGRVTQQPSAVTPVVTWDTGVLVNLSLVTVVPAAPLAIATYVLEHRDYVTMAMPSPQYVSSPRLQQASIDQGVGLGVCHVVRGASRVFSLVFMQTAWHTSNSPPPILLLLCAETCYLHCLPLGPSC